jgi:hypothetical protein
MTKLRNLGLVTLLASSAFACSVERTEAVTSGYYFTGWAYDGVSNRRLEESEYDIFLTYGQKTVPGSINPDTGRFWVGPVEPFHDYFIQINADGYRQFYAAESFLVNAARGADGTQSQLFEAFLFPEDLLSPELTFTIQTPDGTQPDGQIRVTPANDVGESILNLQGDIDGSVDGQVWDNDADRKFETVVADVEGGVVTFAEGDLVYGVEYEATVFAADGYALQGFTFRSGVTDNQTVVLPRLTEQALAITANSLDYDDDGLDPFATIVLTFNQNIELSLRIDEGSVREAFDDNVSIGSSDFDGDMEVNQLLTVDTDEDDALENGARFTIDGNTLTLSWDRDPGNFFVQDDDDPITSATYDLSNIRLKPAGERTGREVQLSVLYQATVTVQVDPVLF